MSLDDSPYMFASRLVVSTVRQGSQQEVRLPRELHGAASGERVPPSEGLAIRLRPVDGHRDRKDVPAKIIRIDGNRAVVGPRD